MPDCLGLLWEGGSAAVGMVGDVLNNVFGTKLKWGSDAADISSMRAGAGAMTSENARDIVNQGDTRMSDRDLVAAESMESMGVLDSSQEGVSAIKTIAGLKWRRLLLNMGVPYDQVYTPDEYPTRLGIPPQFGGTGLPAGFNPKGTTPPVMGAGTVPGGASSTQDIDAEIEALKAREEELMRTLRGSTP